MSPIYVAHNYRGWLQGLFGCGVVALDRRNIVHKDELIVTNPDNTEDRYKYLNNYVNKFIYGKFTKRFLWTSNNKEIK